METVSRLVAAKRESSQKAKIKKRQQQEKRTRQGRKPEEGRKKKSESLMSIPTEQPEFTSKMDPPKTSSSEILEPFLHLKPVEKKPTIETKLSSDSQSQLHVEPEDHPEVPLGQKKINASTDNSMKHKLSFEPNHLSMEQMRSDVTRPGEMKLTAETSVQFSERKDPVIHQAENILTGDKVSDSTRHSPDQFQSTNAIVKNSQPVKEVSKAKSKTLEIIKQDIKRRISKKEKLSDSTKMPSNVERPQDLTLNSLNSSKPDVAMNVLKCSSEESLAEQENPGNYIKGPESEIMLMNVAENSLNTGKQESQLLDTNEEISEEKRFNELKRLLKAKKHVEAKKLCEAKSIKDETKHAVVKELIKEKNQCQLQDTARETKPELIDKELTAENEIKEDKPEVKIEQPVGDQLQGALKETGAAVKKPGENGGEVVIKRKRGRPRKYRPEDGKGVPNSGKSETGGSAVVKMPRRRKKKAAGTFYFNVVFILLTF